MRRSWWLYGIFVVLIAALLLGFFKLQQVNNVDMDDTYFNLQGRAVSSGYGVLNEDSSYFRSVVRLDDVYEENGIVLADVQWMEDEVNEQTIEISNRNGLNYVYVTKQDTKELYPVSSEMDINEVGIDDLISELKPYENTDVIMDFYTKSPNINELPSQEAKDYITALQPYIECNLSFSNVIIGDLSNANCRPFSHQIYVIQK